jgi:hypothetical protein
VPPDVARLVLCAAWRGQHACHPLGRIGRRDPVVARAQNYTWNLARRSMARVSFLPDGKGSGSQKGGGETGSDQVTH